VSRVILLCLLFVQYAAGQEASQPPEHDMSNMQMAGMNAAGGVLMNLASGTSMSPESGAMPMEMVSAAGWNFMFMGQAFLVDTQQTGPRGGDKFYSPNWGMFGAGHDIGHGSLLFDLMLSLDPATITERRYPELFQTAGGRSAPARFHHGARRPLRASVKRRYNPGAVLCSSGRSSSRPGRISASRFGGRAS